MVTLITRRNSEDRVIDPETPVISMAIIEDMFIAEELPSTFASVHSANVLVKMLKNVEAVYDWLTGSPMTQRGRMYRDLEERIPDFDMYRINT